MNNDPRETKDMTNEILNIQFFNCNLFSLVNVSTKMNAENCGGNW